MNEPIRLSDEDAARLAVALHDAFGWEMSPENRVLVESRLRRRLAELSLPAFSDYVWLLTYDRRRAEELVRLADLLSVRETYFYREENQLRAFSEEILPILATAGNGRGPVRIWSAGCASGEEAWTLAMLALESKAASHGVEVVGTDIAPKALEAARRGEYDDGSVRRLPGAMRDRWLVRSGTRWSVGEELRSRVRFFAANLLHDPAPGMFDVAVCRNVAIYFSAKAKRELARRLHDALVPAGWLLLGHAESLVSVTSDFELVTLKNDLAYRRPGAAG